MPTYPQERKLDHFKIYLIREIKIERKPSLMGQFDRKPRRVTLDRIIWLANPVQKKRRILDKDAHFLGYSFLQQEPTREVEFSNQFGGKQHVVIQDTVVLLVPVEKFRDNSRFPKDLDHFKCYVVQQPTSFKLKPPITLSDQFDKLRGRKETITELSPAFFCVPVDKNDTKRKNLNAHLVLYDITPHDVLNPPLPATVRGQFGTVPLVATESILLGVPTQKTKWKEVGKPKG